MTSSHYFNCFCQQIRLSRGAQKGGDSAYLASTHLATRMAQFCALSLAVSDFLDRKPLRTTAFQSAPGLLDAMSAVVPANAIEGNESTKRRRSTGYIDELGADLRKKKRKCAIAGLVRRSRMEFPRSADFSVDQPNNDGCCLGFVETTLPALVVALQRLNVVNEFALK